MAWKMKLSPWAVTPVISSRATIFIFICQGYRDERKKMFVAKVFLSLYHSPNKVFVLV